MTLTAHYWGSDMLNRFDFTKKMIFEIPELAPLFEEHKTENGELLPHLFFGELTRYVSKIHADSVKGNRNALNVLTRILDIMEEGMAFGVGEIQELIAVSFLENLDRNDPDHRRLTEFFGPHLKMELKNIEGGTI